MVLVGMVVGCAVMALAAPPSVQLAGVRRPEEPEHVPSMAPEPPPEPTDPTGSTAPSAEQITAPAPSTAVSTTPLPPAPAPKPAVTSIKKGGKRGKHRDRGRDLAKMAPAAVASAPVAAAAVATAPAPSTITITKPGSPQEEEITWVRRLRWIGLAAVPSSLMLGVTTYMSTDISSIPLFWVVPLALYLFSFILVFMRAPVNWLEQAHDFVLYIQPALLALLAVFMAIASTVGVVWMAFAMLGAFFLTALACHGEMARDRPSAKHLTEFYLLMSVGGAIGGLFNGIIAPLIFTWGVIEFGLALGVAGFLRPKLREFGWTEQFIANMGQDAGKHHHGKAAKKIVKTSASAPNPLLFDVILGGGIWVLLGVLLMIFSPAGNPASYTERYFYALIVPAICTACFFSRPLRFGLALSALLIIPGLYSRFAEERGTVVYTTRSYFGLLRVLESTEGFGEGRTNVVPVQYHSLMHGTTHHGMNLGTAMEKDKKWDLSRVSTTYYHRQGPVGICMERYNWFPKKEYWEPEYLLNFASDTRGHLSLMMAMAPGGIGTVLPQDALVGLQAEPAYATIGLGTGTMSTYAHPMQTLHFYEIDENIRRFSLPDPGGTAYFGYLQAALNRGANVKVLMGDARLRMAMPWVPEDMTSADPQSIPFDKRGGAENYYHLMVVDAFSSDAIPRHLITKEAMEMYFRHLVEGHWGQWIDVKEGDPSVDKNGNKLDPRFYYEDETTGDKVIRRRPWYPGGVLCVHTSNRHLRLVPVVTDTMAAVEWDRSWSQDYAEGKTKEVSYAARNADGTLPRVKGLVAVRGHDSSPGSRDMLHKKSDIGHFTSEWVMVARDPKDLKHLQAPERYSQWCKEYQDQINARRSDLEEPYWQPQSPTGAYVWTDDHTNLMAVFRWPWDKH
jgi:hypothetical protein